MPQVRADGGLRECQRQALWANVKSPVKGQGSIPWILGAPNNGVIHLRGSALYPPRKYPTRPPKRVCPIPNAIVRVPFGFEIRLTAHRRRVAETVSLSSVLMSFASQARISVVGSHRAESTVSASSTSQIEPSSNLMI
jgi:hypothetical protein